MLSLTVTICFLVLFLAPIGRLHAIISKSASEARSSTPRKSTSDTCSLAVFLGSGGHTSEALALVSTLDFSRYHPRKYIVSDGDTLSTLKAAELEQGMAKSENLTGLPLTYEVITIPRARRVHQSLLTTPPTAVWSLVYSLRGLAPYPLLSGKPFADVLLLNGPGTCLVLCIAVYILRFFGLPTPKLVYVESFARINSLSLSGKLLRPFVDRFVVQWPQLLKDGRRGDCRGWLV